MSEKSAAAKKKSDTEDIIYQCLDYNRPSVLCVFLKRANPLAGTLEVTRTVSANAANQYVINGLDEFREEMHEGLKRAIERKSLKCVNLTDLKDGKPGVLPDSLREKTPEDELREATLLNAEKQETIEEMQAKIAELEKQLAEGSAT